MDAKLKCSPFHLSQASVGIEFAQNDKKLLKNCTEPKIFNSKQLLIMHFVIILFMLLFFTITQILAASNVSLCGHRNPICFKIFIAISDKEFQNPFVFNHFLKPLRFLYYLLFILYPTKHGHG